jgi:hypothetical protein
MKETIECFHLSEYLVNFSGKIGDETMNKYRGRRFSIREIPSHYVLLLWIFLAVFFARDASASWDQFLCEWKLSPSLISVRCPRFSWNSENQTAYRILVATTTDNLKEGGTLIWDSSKVLDSLQLTEYGGKPLADNATYFWKVKIWDAQGIERDYSPIQQFKTAFDLLPVRNMKTRTFLNFGQDDAFISSHYDVTFRSASKKYRPSIIALNYSLLGTMVMPSERASLLEKFCQTKGLATSGILEEFFLHLKEDQDISLYVGAERPENPVQTRRVPGWDPLNDKNGDGIVDDLEYANRPNIKASARKKSEARVPIYYWGPPNYDYVMNIAHPLFQDFLANIYVPLQLKDYDGIFFDTITNYVPGPGQYAKILEIPDNAAWKLNLLKVFGKIKGMIGKSLIVGNGWYSDPFVIDGTEREEWLSIRKSIYEVESALQSAIALDTKGKIQFLQYNPTYNSPWVAADVKAATTMERDTLFGLALYYLVQGNYTYFGTGKHPYDKPESSWFQAMDYDIGAPVGSYKVFASAEQTLPKENLLKNPSFETNTSTGGLEGWTTEKPIETTTENKRTGSKSVKIISTSSETNSINSQYVTLEPYTIYTAGGFIATEQLEGDGGAQIYPYGADDITYIDNWEVFLRGTLPWTFSSFVFKTGKSGQVRINFRIKGAKGIAWFDNIFLIKGSYPNWKVFRREYKNAVVLVKVGPSTPGPGDGQPIRVDPGGNSYSPLRWDGSLGEPITQTILRKNEASILIRTVLQKPPPLNLKVIK